MSALHYNDLGRVDDLWSLAFSLLELATGELPWENMYSRGLGKAEKQAAKIKVLKIKERFVAASLHGDPASCSILKESADYLRRVLGGSRVGGSDMCSLVPSVDVTHARFLKLVGVSW